MLFSGYQSICEEEALLSLHFDIVVYDLDVVEELPPTWYSKFEKSLKVILYNQNFPQYILQAPQEKRSKLAPLFQKNPIIPEIDLVPVEKPPEESLVVAGLNELKRLHFLRFVLCMGLNFPAFEDLYRKLRQF